jgi:hypothetical protein
MLFLACVYGDEEDVEIVFQLQHHCGIWGI